MQVRAPESIYAPPEAMAEEQAVNNGGVSFTLNATFFSDYIFRGIDRSESSGTEDSGNTEVEGQMRFELGKLPDLFMGVFTNINDSDPISRFQEIRPYFGLELTARPIIFTVGNTFYIYPDRDQFNTAEVFARIMLDDSYFFRSDDPVFSPYVLGAWGLRQVRWVLYRGRRAARFQVGRAAADHQPDRALRVRPEPGILRQADRSGERSRASTSAPPATTPGFQHYELGWK
jgi:hypothetical protein